ncbi:hypothetical protein TWF694_001814 [Orbilia ellipsospora]|uniref:Uncharacterized protein n=1 Tax=Orbilia ellipsospora TaxID=2528407 RepID=A0AAV9X3R0_9PEZI
MNRFTLLTTLRRPRGIFFALWFRQLSFPNLNYQRLLSTTPNFYNKDKSSPAGSKERPELPSDKDRTAQSPKSSDEKILDRAQQGEKDKAPFTEEEQKRKRLDQQEGIGEGEQHQHS